MCFTHWPVNDCNCYYNVYYAWKFMYYVVHLLFYCVSCLIFSYFVLSFLIYFVLSIFIKLWEVPGRSPCDLFAQHANAQSHKFNMAKRHTTTTWAHAGVTERYRDRWKAMTMGNGPNDAGHVVWALGECISFFFSFVFIDSNACFFAYTASNLHTTRYGDRQKSTTMGNGPNENRHVVWALGARFQPF